MSRESALSISFQIVPFGSETGIPWIFTSWVSHDGVALRHENFLALQSQVFDSNQDFSREYWIRSIISFDKCTNKGAVAKLDTDSILNTAKDNLSHIVKNANGISLNIADLELISVQKLENLPDGLIAYCVKLSIKTHDESTASSDDHLMSIKN